MKPRSPANRGPAVHSVVATALADPARLEAWSVNPAELAQFEVDPADFDFEAVADFAGLSEKIRHNGCRDHLRMTFQVLNASGLEIQLFRDYTPCSLKRRQRGLTSPMDRIEGLAAFVGGWAQSTEPVRGIVRDIIWHEHAVAVLRAAQEDQQSSCTTTEPNAASIPAHNGALLVRTLTYDPRRVQEVLDSAPDNLVGIRRGSWTFAYHKVAGQLRVLEVDRAVADLIAAADGKRSVERIAAHLLGDGTDAGALLPFFAQLVEIGVLRWRDREAERCG